MAEWFPAIRGYLAERGIRLPRPYPHTGRTLTGSALAALLAASLLGTVYTVRLAVRAAYTATETASARLDEAAHAATQTVYESAGAVTAGSDAVENALARVGVAAAVLATDAVRNSAHAVTAGSHNLEEHAAALPARLHAWLAELLTPSPEVKAALERQRLEYERSRHGEDAAPEQSGTLAGPAPEDSPSEDRSPEDRMEETPVADRDGPDLSEMDQSEMDRAEAIPPDQNSAQAWPADEWGELLADLPSGDMPPLPFAAAHLRRLGMRAALTVPQAVLQPRPLPLPHPSANEQAAGPRSPTGEDEGQWRAMITLPAPLTLTPLPPVGAELRQWRALLRVPAPLEIAPRLPSAEDISQWRALATLPSVTACAPLPPSPADVRQWRLMASLPAPLRIAPPPPLAAELRQWRALLRVPAPLDLVPRLPSGEDIRQWRVMAAVPPFTAFAPLPPSGEDVRQWRIMSALPAPFTLAPPPPSAEDVRQWRVISALPAPLRLAPPPPSRREVMEWRRMISWLDLPAPPPSADNLRQWAELAARPAPRIGYGRPGPLVPPDAVAEVRESIIRNALPYPENADAPVADVVKQIDFALLQTVARLRLEEGRIFLLGRENRGEGEHRRPCQRMKIYLPKLEQGDTAVSFAGLLAGTLEVWSERAALSRPAWNRLVLSVDGLPTHDLRLEVVGDEFLLPPLEDGPRLTVVIDDMGANPKAIDELLDLDVPVTVAIWPRSRYAAETARTAHAAGREVLIHQPMEPVQAPYVNAGPGAITLHTPPDRIREILAENLKLVPFASGLNNHMGSRFTQNPDFCAIVCDVAAEAGLFTLDSVTHANTVFYETALRRGLPAYRRNIFLDDGPRTVKSVLEELRAAEAVARKDGQAVAIGHPHPETLTALRQWCATRDTSIQIVPLRHLRQHGSTLTPADLEAF